MILGNLQEGWLQPANAGDDGGPSPRPSGTFTMQTGNPALFSARGAYPYNNGYWYKRLGPNDAARALDPATSTTVAPPKWFVDSQIQNMTELREIRELLEVLVVLLPYLGSRRRARAEEILALPAVSRQAERTHCIRGHELSGDNLRLIKYGGGYHRRCKACERWRYHERRTREAAIA